MFDEGLMIDKGLMFDQWFMFYEGLILTGLKQTWEIGPEIGRFSM